MQQSTAKPVQTRGLVIHWARGYDVLTGTVPFLRALRHKLLELASPAPGEHVLDVGCGTGRLALAMAARMKDGKVHGIDASPEMITVAKKKAAKACAEVTFEQAAIEALPFADGSFDLVTSSLMLHHLPEDVKRKGRAI